MTYKKPIHLIFLTYINDLIKCLKWPLKPPKLRLGTHTHPQMLETDLNCFADEIDGLELICEDVGMDMSAPPTSVNIQKENIKAR